MIFCVCCGRYRVEEIILDTMRGAGPKRHYRLIQQAEHGGVYLVAQVATLDELAAELDEWGILMWPAEDDGCE